MSAESLSIPLDVQLFGPFKVNFRDHSPIEFRSNTERALLAYLAAESNQPYSREFLRGLIWPELNEEKARNNLRVTLSRLRKSLNNSDHNAAVVTASGTSVQLNAGKVAVDVSTFMQLIGQTQLHVHSPHADCPECMVRLEQAAQIFRGEFLQGFFLSNNIPFQEWMVVQREKFNRHAMETFSTLADYYLRRGQLDKVRAYAQRQLELEPWREEAHRQLMTCFAIRDQKNVALAQYEQCKRILDEELGVEPSYKTQTLYNHIKKSRGRKRPSFPVTSTSFVGRKKEQAKIIQILSEPDCRQLTITGMEGIGKTRLAAQIAAQLDYAFLDGTIFVPLAAVEMPEEIPNAVADALEFSFVGNTDPFQQLLNYLENREYLIVLDDFEQLLAAVPLLERIWKQCPRVKLLITSRERLGLEQEYLIKLNGLSTPETTGNSMQSSPAVELLLECIHRYQPSFEPTQHDLQEMAELCELVEGMPLALELVAPMVQVLSFQEIIHGIQAFELSGLESVFERSWSLLTTEEQTGFMQLSIFKTPFTRESSSEVAQIDLAMFTSLVDKSLIRRVTSTVEAADVPEMVFFDFHPLLKRFAYQKLCNMPEMLNRSQANHANYFLGLIDRLYENILTPNESSAIKRIHAQHEDIIAAMKWGCIHGRYASIRKGLQIHIHYFESYGTFRLGKYFFGEMAAILREVERKQETPANELRQVLARALAYYGWHLMRLGEYRDALGTEDDAVQLARKSHDRSMEAGALNTIGLVQRSLGNLDRSNQYLESALETVRRPEGSLEDRWFRASIHVNLGINAMMQSKLELAGTSFDMAMKLYEEIGHFWGIIGTYLAYGNLYMRLGKDGQAQDSFEKGMELAEVHNYQWMKIKLLVCLGDLAFKRKDWETAVSYYQQSFDSIGEFGDKAILEEAQEKFQQAGQMAQLS